MNTRESCYAKEGRAPLSSAFQLPIYPTHLPNSSVLEIFPQYRNYNSQPAKRNGALGLPQRCGLRARGYEVCTPEDAGDDHQPTDGFDKSAALPLRFFDSGLDSWPLLISLTGCRAPFVLDDLGFGRKLLHSDTLSHFALKFN